MDEKVVLRGRIAELEGVIREVRHFYCEPEIAG